MQFIIHRHDTVGSTMDVCRALADAGAPEGTVVTADVQLAGRGRVGHTWFAPAGQSLMFSLVLRPTKTHVNWITMLAALAVLDAALETVQAEVGRVQPTHVPALTLKWFNDVHADGKKICGILVEEAFNGDALDYAILGIGLNVNTHFDAAPEDVRGRATSLAEVCGRPFDREAVFTQLRAALDRRYTHMLQNSHSPATEYARHVETLGRTVQLKTGDEVVSGIALRVEEDGALVLQTPSGERVIRFGDVVG